MGKVYRATQVPLGREVALKVLHPSYAGDQDPEFHRRFTREASIASRLTHPNTVTVFDYGRTEDDVYFIAMELLEGVTLRHAIRRESPFPRSRALHIARQVCRSLREAHQAGVIHRDLKPANVFLVRHGDEGDFVKVLDFGLVKDLSSTDEDLTQTGLFMGSPKYMPPEQIRGDAVDPRADLYSLGVILFEMLTGSVPFDRASSMHTLMAHVHDAPPSLLDVNPAADVTPALEEIVLACMAKDPAERFRDMDELLVALKRVTGDPLSRDAALSGDSGFGSFPWGPVPRPPSVPPPSPSSWPPPSGDSSSHLRASVPPPAVPPRTRDQGPPPASRLPPTAPASQPPRPAAGSSEAPPEAQPTLPPSTPPGVVRLDPSPSGSPSARWSGEPTGRHAALSGEVTRLPAPADAVAPAGARDRYPWSSWLVVGLVGILGLVLGGLVVVFMSRPGPPAASATGASPADPAPEGATVPSDPRARPADDPPPPPSPAVPARTELRLGSSPEGATVRLGDGPEPLGKTPTVVDLPTEPGHEQVVRFELDGYLPVEQRVVLAGSPVALDVDLERARPRAPGPRPASAEAPREPDVDVAETVRRRLEATAAPAEGERPARSADRDEAAPDAPPGGYKDDPY